jgi:hypothetical protein
MRASVQTLPARVPTTAVVEDLEVLEDRVSQLDARLPPLTIEQFDLHAAPERLERRVIVTGATWDR